MGKVLMPCNLTEEERQEAWEEFDEYLTPEEENVLRHAAGREVPHGKNENQTSKAIETIETENIE